MLLQSADRGLRARKARRALAQRQARAAARVQATYRGRLVRQALEWEAAAYVIQLAWRLRVTWRGRRQLVTWWLDYLTDGAPRTGSPYGGDDTLLCMAGLRHGAWADWEVDDLIAEFDEGGVGDLETGLLWCTLNDCAGRITSAIRWWGRCGPPMVHRMAAGRIQAVTRSRLVRAQLACVVQARAWLRENKGLVFDDFAFLRPVFGRGGALIAYVIFGRGGCALGARVGGPHLLSEGTLRKMLGMPTVVAKAKGKAKSRKQRKARKAVKEEGACFDQLHLLSETRDVWKGDHLVRRCAELMNFYGLGGSRGVSKEECATGAYGQELMEWANPRGDDVGLGDDDDFLDDDDFGYDFIGRQTWAPSAPAVAGGARA